jgi:hypothetical protein
VKPVADVEWHGSQEVWKGCESDQLNSTRF